MDVLLVNPRTPSPYRVDYYHTYSMPPMMLAYLAAYLLEQDADVEILDLRVSELDAEGFQSYIKEQKPRIVGITCFTEDYTNCLTAAELIKSVSPDSKVIVGGPHVTFTARDTLKNSCIDIVVRGEGEITFLQLVEHFLEGKGDLSEIRGIAYHNDGEITLTGARPLIKDLDSLPFPARHLLDLTKYPFPVAVSTSRGCPQRCVFCSAAAMAGGKYRMRSPDRVVEEIDCLMRDFPVHHVSFIDDTISADPVRAKALCQLIRERGLGFTWDCESRVDVVDVDLLKVMAETGCRAISFGFESGSDYVLKSIRKKITKEQMENAVIRSLELGIQPGGNFMIGHPEDTEETIRETVEFAKLLKSYGAGIDLAITTPFPGTYLSNHADELGVEILSDEWSDFRLDNPIINTKYLTVDQIRSLYFDLDSELAAVPSPQETQDFRASDWP